MKKAIAIFFLFIFLCTNTVFGEVLRLPTLVHHYLEHVEWDNNASILSFLEKHYADKITHPDDKHGDHGKLPFKSMDHSVSQVLTIVPKSVTYIQETIFVEAMAVSLSAYAPQDYSNSYLEFIWQPPRFS